MASYLVFGVAGERLHGYEHELHAQGNDVFGFRDIADYVPPADERYLSYMKRLLNVAVDVDFVLITDAAGDRTMGSILEATRRRERKRVHAIPNSKIGITPTSGNSDEFRLQ